MDTSTDPRAQHRALPTVEFDIVKEALVAAGVVMALVLACAAIFGGPYSPAITIRQVARQHPRAVVATAMRDLMGQSRIARYGPPYTPGNNYQHIGPFAPAHWFGVTHPIDPAEADVLHPLARAAVIDPAVGTALGRWKQAGPQTHKAWGTAFEAALPHARVTANGSIVLPGTAQIASGPLPRMMDGLLGMARAGLLASAINGPGDVYHYSEPASLLFLQGDVLHKIAARRDLLGTQWGIVHEEGPYPGPWWVAPYSFLYQIPPYSTSPNGDMMAALTMGLLFLLLLLLPVLPGVRSLPRRLRVYRWIWRDYYSWVRGDGKPRGSVPAGVPAAALHGGGVRHER